MGRAVRHASQLLKVGAAGFVAGAVPFTLFGFLSGGFLSGPRDPGRDVLNLLICSGIGILAAMAIMMAYNRMQQSR